MSEIECDVCGELVEIETDLFKKKGTYWFDGSADAAGLTRKWFISHCGVFRELHKITAPPTTPRIERHRA